MSNINVGAMILAALVQMVIGAVWYSPLMFAPSWMKAMGKKLPASAAEMRPMPQLLAVQVLATLVEAYVLAELARFVGVNSALQGGELGFLLGAGIVATAVAGDYLFAGRGKVMYLINMSYTVVGLIAMGAILGAWR